MICRETVLKRNSDIASRIIEGEAVLISPVEGVIRVLNPVGSRIWELMENGKSVRMISETISQEFDVDCKTAESETMEFAESLLQMELILIENSGDSQA